MQICITPTHLNLTNQTNSNTTNSNNIANVNVNLTNNNQTVSLTSLPNSNNINNNNNNSNGMLTTSTNLINTNLLGLSTAATQAAAHAAASVALNYHRQIMHREIYSPQQQSHNLNPLVSGLFQNSSSANNNNNNQMHSNSNNLGTHTIQSNLQNAYRSRISGQSSIIPFHSMVPLMTRMPRIQFLDRSLEDIVRFEENLLNLNRGATQEIIEANTLPYKYVKLMKNEDNEKEKCTICLTDFEEQEDVR